MQPVISVLRLFNVLDTIEGRKKLHKIIHILQRTGFEKEFSQDFSYLHYGPYSEDVSYEISTLTKEQLIEEQQHAGDAYLTYIYKNTARNRTLLKSIKQDAKPKWEARAKYLNAKSAQDLEAISTILFLQRNGFEGERLKTRFGELKPNLKAKFPAALNEIEKIKTK
jgi:uncharacterized protein YwgA